MYRNLIGKPEGKRPLGRSWRRWKNTKIGLEEVGYRRVTYTHLAKDKYQWLLC
jgi:hypothetical protein